MAASADFWSNKEQAQEVQKERARLESQLSAIENLSSSISDSDVMLSLLSESADAELAKELESSLENSTEQLRTLELEKMLSGTHDGANAIIEINAGAGGTEAQDWAEMLLRMYTRWVDKRNFSSTLLNVQGLSLIHI